MSNLIKSIERRNAERAMFAHIFKEAGFQHVAMDEIANRYWADVSGESAPWFMVATEKGFFVIGWRKRVIHIEWSGLITPPDLFADADVTKGPEHIHAWGQSKAIEYLSRVRERSELSDPEDLERYRSRAEVAARIALIRKDLDAALETWQRTALNMLR
jgi:hypothetical protein